MSENFSEFMKDRAKVFKFLSAIYRDEIPKELLSKMKDEKFLTAISKVPGGEKLAEVMKDADVDKVFNELRYEYADIFLNAGVTPVFPYESVYVTGEPLVMQKPVFEVRKFFREAGVHKSEDYPDLDDHIAVEFEFMRYLCENEKVELQANFVAEHFKWMKDFCDNLKKYSQADFYKAVAELTESIVSMEEKIVDDIKNSKLPEASIVDAIKAIAEAVNVLDIGDEYVTIKEGAKPEEPEKIINTHCYLCGGLCGLRITVKDGIMVKVAGLPGDPKSGGMICPKGASNIQHTYSAYRLKWPLIKENGRFRKATWEEAMSKFAELLKSIEPSKVGFLRGNNFNAWLTAGVFKAYGAYVTTHRPMCDNSIRMANEHNLNDKRPWIDYRESDYIILWGVNETCTSYGRRKVKFFQDALKRGAKLVVFDTRKSEVAELADEWIAPKPGTDGAIAMAMCYVIVKNELYNKEFVENWTYGFEDFKKRLLGEEDGVPRTPEWAEKISGVPAATIERIAIEFANAKHPATICWAGIAQTPNGFYATQAIMALNGLMGTFDAPGGPSLPFKRKLKSPFGDGPKLPNNSPKEKLDKAKMWAGWIPAYFPRDVEEGKLQALVCYWGSPVLSWTNQDAAIEALKKLKFIVTIDAFMNNTATLSDLVIPSVSSLEMEWIHPDWLYDAFISSHRRAIDPLFNCKPEWWIFIDLAKRLGFGEYFPSDDIEYYLRNMLKGTPWDYDELMEKGYIITDKAEYYKYKKWGSLNPPEGYGSSGKTKTGKYNFKNPVAEEKGIDPLPDYKPIEEEYPELVPDEKYPLIAQSFRLLQHEHSSTFNNPYLMKLRGTNPLWINPLDAKERGIENGDKVIIESPWGKAEATAYVTWKIRQGVVGAAGGFGHWRGLEADPRFPQYGGFNIGGLMPPNYPDKYGGNPLLKYIKVNVRKAE